MVEQYKGPNIDEFRVDFDLRNKHSSDILIDGLCLHYQKELIHLRSTC